jgi:hypothetical protein
MSSFEHIKKLNELMGAYTAALNRLEMTKKDSEGEEDEVVKSALRVISLVHLKKARSVMMDVETEFHRYLSSLDAQ